MGVLHVQYGRFLRWLTEREVDPDTRRVAKIVFAHLDSVAATSAAGGGRSRVLVPWLRSELTEVNDEIDVPPEQDAADLAWTRLKRLEVGPFRGFRRPEEFDLQKDIVLFSGPNGTGKTSLCEALEFALTGEVEEASARRIEIAEYLDNIHAQTHEEPRLYPQGDGETAPIFPQPEALQFAIIERNRIDSFARLAARTPAQAESLIASLFGLDAFNELVRNFASSIDGHLKLERPRQEQLAQRQQERDRAIERLAAASQALIRLDAERVEIAEEFEPGCSYERLSGLLGASGSRGRLDELQEALEQRIPEASGWNRERFTTLRRELKLKHREHGKIREQLQARASEVSYRSLYSAVIDLQSDGADRCPACETPLDRVTTDPFARATRGLELLASLAELEQQSELTEKHVTRLVHTLKDSIKNFLPFIDGNADDLQRLIEWAHSDDVDSILDGGVLDRETWYTLLRQLRAVEFRDTVIRARLAQRQALVVERDRLQEAGSRLTELSGRRAQQIDAMAADQTLVDGFNETNADLLEAVSRESEIIQFEQRIANAYDDYCRNLQEYSDSLPEELLGNLNELTCDFYNRINAYGVAGDSLAHIALPRRGGERIMVAFRRAPEDQHDALQILSEGHIRCIGLAILLAKNVKLGLPLIVFDDVVNAIDDAHRTAIRELLIGDDRLRQKQLLITCHSPEFIRMFQNVLDDGTSTLYSFGPHLGDYQPRIMDGTDRNYLSRARASLEEGDPGQCLAFCRQALEYLTHRAWKSLANKSEDLATFKVKLGGPNARPHLLPLAIELEKAMARGLDAGVLRAATWTARLEGFRSILHVDQKSALWAYLNDGTHHDDDKPDFEIPLVSQMIDGLSAIRASYPG